MWHPWKVRRQLRQALELLAEYQRLCEKSNGLCEDSNRLAREGLAREAANRLTVNLDPPHPLGEVKPVNQWVN